MTAANAMRRIAILLVGACSILVPLLSAGQAGDMGPSLDSPECIKAPEDRVERDSDEVLGVTRKGESCAYPLRLMAYHRIVNDHLGGLILVAYDPDSGTDQMFDRSLDGRELNFEVSEPLRGAPRMRDRETKSVWSVLTGQAVEGALRGKRLARINSVVLTWQRWTALHPDSYVLKEDPRLSAHYVVRSTPAVCPLPVSVKSALPAKPDARLKLDTLVLGVCGERPKAFPLGLLETGRGVITDEVGNDRLVVFTDPKSRASAAYVPVVSGKPLTFTAQDRNGVRVFLDVETRSVWTLEGVAVEGAMKGASLAPAPFVRSRWYAWSSAFPKTEVYRPRRAAAKGPFSSAR